MTTQVLSEAYNGLFTGFIIIAGLCLLPTVVALCSVMWQDLRDRLQKKKCPKL